MCISMCAYMHMYTWMSDCMYMWSSGGVNFLPHIQSRRRNSAGRKIASFTLRSLTLTSSHPARLFSFYVITTVTSLSLVLSQLCLYIPLRRLNLPWCFCKVGAIRSFNPSQHAEFPFLRYLSRFHQKLTTNAGLLALYIYVERICCISVPFCFIAICFCQSPTSKVL